MLIIPESFKLVKKRAWTQDEHHTKESFFEHGQEASGPSCKYGTWHLSHSSRKGIPHPHSGWPPAFRTSNILILTYNSSRPVPHTAGSGWCQQPASGDGWAQLPRLRRLLNVRHLSYQSGYQEAISYVN